MYVVYMYLLYVVNGFAISNLLPLLIDHMKYC